jgi:hypothetical protein
MRLRLCCLRIVGVESELRYVIWESNGRHKTGAGAERAAKLARVMAPCRLGSGRCMVEVLFALLITETSELGVCWRYETSPPRRRARRRGCCRRCVSRHSSAQRGKTARTPWAICGMQRRSVPWTGHMYCQQRKISPVGAWMPRPQATMCHLENRAAAGANASSRSAVFVVVHSDV